MHQSTVRQPALYRAFIVLDLVIAAIPWVGLCAKLMSSCGSSIKLLVGHQLNEMTFTPPASLR